jgi:uncharacterized membrane protein YhaH (DUF805 family)
MNLGHILFSFSGRINRAKWWLAVLVMVLLQLAMYVLAHAMPTDGVISIVGFIVSIVVLWVSLAAGAKRLHDLNRSALWLVLFIGGHILLGIIFFGYAGMAVFTTLAAGQELSAAEAGRIFGVALIIGVLALALSIWALVWFGCLRGTVGPNQYGPDPLEGRV